MADGYVGLLAPWIGGAADPGASPGYVGLLAPWIGGAGSPSAADAGYVSLLAFWAGGAASSGEPPPVVEPPPELEQQAGRPRRFRFRPRREEDIYAITLSILQLVNYDD